MTTALLVDDEPNLSAYLARMLGRVWPELHILGTAENGRQALAMAAEHAPDIVFLDIRMPGLSGLQVAESLHPEVRIVFVTAHDEYAIRAFEAAAVDYLLKPVQEDRLRRTIDRVRKQVSPPDPDSLAEVLERLKTLPDGHLRWLRSQQGGATRLIPVDAVVYFQAGSKYTAVITATDEYLIRLSIQSLEAQLDPAVFWRVHRSIIVRVAEIAQASRDLRGRYELRLRSRPEILRSSQKYGHLFRGM